MFIAVSCSACSCAEANNTGFSVQHVLRLRGEPFLRSMDAFAVLQCFCIVVIALNFVLLFKQEPHYCVECRIFLMLAFVLK